MLEHIDGSAVTVECQGCSSHWCLINNCSFQADGVLMEQHQKTAHSEYRNLSTFNSTSNIKCNCEGKTRVPVYTNSNTLGLCRSCGRTWCLAQGCNETYSNLLGCVNHQHSAHTVAERNCESDAPATICGACGVKRPAHCLSSNDKSEMCSNCFAVWCMNDGCTKEFVSYNKWAAHNQNDHQQKSRPRH